MPDLPEDLGALLRARAGDAPVPPAASDAVVHAVRRRQYFRAGAFLSGTALAVVAVVGVATAVTPTAKRVVVPPASGGGAASSSPAHEDGRCAFLRAEATYEKGGEVASFGPSELAVTLSGGPTSGPTGGTESTEPAEPSPSDEPTEPTDDPTARAVEPTETPPPTPASPAVEAPGYGFEVEVVDDGGSGHFARSSYETLAGTTCMLVHNPGRWPHIVRVVVPKTPGVVDSATERVVWETDLVEGGNAVIHDDKPLAAGRYQMYCAVHPAAKAELVVR